MKQEQEEYRYGFNKVKLSDDELILASKRLEISKVWSKRLLNISFILNCASIILILSAVVFVVLKPDPSYYGSTPSGKLYKLNSVRK